MSSTTLKDFAERGILQVVNTQPIPQTIEETPEFKKHAALKGKKIHLSAASRQYNLTLSSISKYVRLNIIKKLGRDRNRILLDEAYVAYVAEVKRNSPGQGIWLFDQNGLPYTPSTRERA
jgi:hypothetical protein